MTPAWPFGKAQDALKSLHLAVITPAAKPGGGDDLIDTEIITRELRQALVVVCELDDEWEGCWRRRLWVRTGAR